ncbi:MULTISPECIES: type IV conjugative transfer system coupling protein TraD [unclassified Gilliamella]|uniref:type IV conjugative transfer system coupling protein TraD n=1 Tax=unclassified Gilliamella TaxID=2685620 RepID=UPI001580AE06|nr:MULTISPECIES: type IV conjugative transfer system coupling protein TraD [unclassified Gilliamella]MCO6550687.1 type IV conjugative transfer system coupling protein TraD [Gilliamella sp.]NUE95338.1 type IV conjugative transfer system coupling protein TraD [Gilliamella sp. ESL0232]
MSNEHNIEAIFRPASELYSAVTSISCAFICLVAPWAVALSTSVNIGVAGAFLLFGIYRAKQGITIIRYKRNIKRLPFYSLTSEQIPVSQKFLFLGRGFKWEQKHLQRIILCRREEYKRFVQPSAIYRAARHWEQKHERSLIAKCTSSNRWFNPVKPLPPVGGNPFLHGVEINEVDIMMPFVDRGGHTLVLGTTGVGKTRLLEVLVTQDIARGDPVIVIDPKGDADLLKRMYAEAKRNGRQDEFYIFHLGYPEISARYNAIGRFSRITEVAQRVSAPLAGEGNSAAFKEFAWRFVNIVTKALIELGRRPDYIQINRYTNNMDTLFLEYAQHYFDKHDPKAWITISEMATKVNDKNVSLAMRGRDKLVVALYDYIAAKKIRDDVLEGLRSAIQYDKTYFDKIVASLMPFLEKLTTGKTAQLLAPDYLDINDERPIFDWEQVIRKKGIVYIGLDALSDAVVGAAVGNSMLADLVSIAGYIYKYGVDDGLPGENRSKINVCLHTDEVNEIMGDEFIPLVNKARGAGINVTAYTQTISDIEVKVGSAAKAGQVQGNFNNIIMLRVRETKTAELITSQLPKVDIYKNTVVSGASDTPSPDTKTDFTSSTQDRISTESMPLLEPSELIQLPRGQAFVLTNGGVLYKVRMPLPSQEQDIMMPDSINTLSKEMAKSYSTGEQWWVNSNSVWEKPEIDNDSDCPEENELPVHLALDIDDDEKAFLHTLQEEKDE